MIVSQLDRRQGSGSNGDLLVCSFTRTGVGLLGSQRCGVPLSGFCLQPTCIPSSDEAWKNVIAIEGGLGSVVDSIEERDFTSHRTLQALNHSIA